MRENDPVTTAVPKFRSSAFRARLIAALTAVGGVLILLTTIPRVAVWLGRFSAIVTPFGIREASYVASVVIGVGLLTLAGQLDRRKHLAWLVTIVLFGLSVWFNLSRGHHPTSSGYSLLMVGLLWFTRDEFRAPGDPPTLIEFLRWTTIWFSAVLVYGMAALFSERDHLSPTPTVGRSLETVVVGLVGVDGPYTYQRRVFGDVFGWSLLVLGISGLAVGIALLFRPFVASPVAGPNDWDRASRLIHQYGCDTLDYFALRDDKLFFFSSDGGAMIAYTYLGRYALASGDPIGSPGSIDLVLDEFLHMCATRAWGAAFLAVREDERERYVSRGLRTVYLGDEAVVPCKGFNLSGKKWKSIRQSANRVARTYHFDFLRECDADADLVAKLNEVSHKWRGKAPERGFTMSLSQEIQGSASEYYLCVARDEAGAVGGFLRIVPVFGEEPGFTLDLMRRDPDTPNGMTEFLLTQTIMQLDERGYSRLSMNFAAWGRLFTDEAHQTIGTRMARMVVSILSPFFQIKSLRTFNERFHPDWVPRVLAFDDRRSLPRVAVLFGGVEGFLHTPIIGKYLLPKTIAHPTAPDRE